MERGRRASSSAQQPRQQPHPYSRLPFTQGPISSSLPLLSTPVPEPGLRKKPRRPSEGGDASSASSVRCRTCGKGYKHVSCLQKHLWEHTPEWSVTSRLLISKHQQVQLLEAASILVNMNSPPTEGWSDDSREVKSEEDAVMDDLDGDGDDGEGEGAGMALDDGVFGMED